MNCSLINSKLLFLIFLLCSNSLQANDNDFFKNFIITKTNVQNQNEIIPSDIEAAFSEYQNPKGVLNYLSQQKHNISDKIFIDQSKSSKASTDEGYITCGFTKSNSQDQETVVLQTYFETKTPQKVLFTKPQSHSKHMIQRKIASCLSGLAKTPTDRDIFKLKPTSPRLEIMHISDSIYKDFEIFLTNKNNGISEGDTFYYQKLLTCSIQEYFKNSNIMGESASLQKLNNKTYEIQISSIDGSRVEPINLQNFDSLFSNTESKQGNFNNKSENLSICKQKIKNEYCLVNKKTLSGNLKVERNIKNIGFIKKDFGVKESLDGSFIVQTGDKKIIKFTDNNGKLISHEISGSEISSDSNAELFGNDLIFLRGDFENPSMAIKHLNSNKKDLDLISSSCKKTSTIQKVNETTFLSICSNGIVEKFKKNNNTWKKEKQGKIATIDTYNSNIQNVGQYVIAPSSTSVSIVNTETLQTIECKGIITTTGSISQDSESNFLISTLDGNLFKAKLNYSNKTCELAKAQKINTEINKGVIKLEKDIHLIMSRNELFIRNKEGTFKKIVNNSNQFLKPTYDQKPVIDEVNKTFTVMDSYGVLTTYDFDGNYINSINTPSGIPEGDPVLLKSGKVIYPQMTGFMLISGLDKINSSATISNCPKITKEANQKIQETPTRSMIAK